MEFQGLREAGGIHFSIQVEADSQQPVDVQMVVEAVDGAPDTWLLRIKVESPGGGKFYIHHLSLSWEIPVVDMHGMYLGGDPRTELSYLPFRRLFKEISAHTGVPYLALVHRNGENRAAFGLLDQHTEMRITTEMSEITRRYSIRFEKPIGSDPALARIPVEGAWEEVLMVSRSTQPWPEVLRQYTSLVTRRQSLMPVPDSAYDPVFCTWTAIHHDVNQEWSLKNARLAADLGFCTWLTDDGWFLASGEFGKYGQVGAWQPYPDKFTDFKAHVASIKELGFRYVLWVAPFMIGTQSEEAKRYAHLLTTGWEPEQFLNLSPWKPETKEIVGSLLRRLVMDYGLDGLKIDFIDAISIHSRRSVDGSDQTLGESIARILQAAVDDLRQVKPDLLIEFRNRYANLASRSYANIYRSSDVPINFTLNRWQAVMLRLLAPDRAVHTDPLLWHPDDTDENVAVHLINAIATVPMVSIELDQYPRSHIDLIRHWIGFYGEHRDTIIHGDFRPDVRLSHIPRIEFAGTGEVITGLYENVSVRATAECGKQWILNASTLPYVEVEEHPGLRCRITGRNKFGEKLFEWAYDDLPHRIDIEIGGSLEIVYA